MGEQWDLRLLEHPTNPPRFVHVFSGVVRGLSLVFWVLGAVPRSPLALLQAQTQIQQQLFLRLQEEAQPQPLQGQRKILQVPKVQVKK